METLQVPSVQAAPSPLIPGKNLPSVRLLDQLAGAGLDVPAEIMSQWARFRKLQDRSDKLTPKQIHQRYESTHLSRNQLCCLKAMEVLGRFYEAANGISGGLEDMDMGSLLDLAVERGVNRSVVQQLVGQLTGGQSQFPAAKTVIDVGEGVEAMEMADRGT